MCRRFARFALVFSCLLIYSKARSAEIEVVYIGNEGFLISSGETRLLIDGLYRGGVAGYVTIPDEQREALELGRPPFDGIDLVLVTHHHADHFDAKAALRHLTSNTGARLVSTPQVVERLQKATREFEAIADRVHAELPPEGERSSSSFSGIDVTALNMHHGRDRKPTVQNLGFLVTLGGVKLLHVGDTQVNGEELAALELEDDAIDVGFIPYWELMSEKRLALFRKSVAPRRFVPMHIPDARAPLSYFAGARDLKEMLAHLAGLPDVVLITEPFRPRSLSGGDRSSPR